MGFIGGSAYLIAMMLSHPLLFFGVLSQQGSKGIQLGRTDGVKKGLDHNFLNRWAIQRHTHGSCIMALEAITLVAHMRFVGNTHAMPTHATAHQPLQERLPFSWGSTCSLHRSLFRV